MCVAILNRAVLKNCNEKPMDHLDKYLDRSFRIVRRDFAIERFFFAAIWNGIRRAVAKKMGGALTNDKYR